MPIHSPCTVLHRLWCFGFTAITCIASISAAHAEAGCPANSAANLPALVDMLAAMPEGSWRQVNENRFSDVWTPGELRPQFAGGEPEPLKIIFAWSGFAWDCRRGDLLLFGGGHANYPGNDTYRWRGSTRLWERMSLPSEITQDSLGNYTAFDGQFAAPSSAHTYDNNVYLPLTDRLLVLGGAAFNNGGAFMLQTGPGTERPTGPYVFDPAKADPNKVGGTTGSHVQRVSPFPEIQGGMMWDNRDIYGSLAGNLPTGFLNGTVAYAAEAGSDVVYLTGSVGSMSAANLYRYTIRDANNALLDSMELVGLYWESFAGRGAGAYDPGMGIFVRTAVDSTATFTLWSLQQPGQSNLNINFMPFDPTGEFRLDRGYGLDFDPIRRQYLLWGGGETVWSLKPPNEVARDGWVIGRAQVTPGGDAPAYDGEEGGGVLGKWKYIPELDAFIGLQDPGAGNVWIYKPVGWIRPGAAIPGPIVSLSANPAELVAGGSTNLTWSSLNATACTASGGWTGNKPISGSESVGPLDASTSFTLTCSGSDQSVAQTVAVNVSAPPPAVSPPTVTLSANPAELVAGGSSTLTWSSTNATACRASGGWTGNKPISGSESVGPLAASTSFTLTCSGPSSVIVLETVSVQIQTKKNSGGGGAAGPLVSFLFASLILGLHGRRRRQGL